MTCWYTVSHVLRRLTLSRSMRTMRAVGNWRLRVDSIRCVPSPSMETDYGRRVLAERPDHPGSLGIAISEAVEIAAQRDDTKYALGSVLNHVLLHQTVIGLEAMQQMEMADAWPDVVLSCTGGGSNFAGIAFPFIGHGLRGGPKPRIVAVEPYENQVLGGGLTGPHGIPDIGYGIVPGNYNAYVVDNVAAVTSTDANRAAQRVLATDAIPASPAAGAALHAAAQLIATGTSRSALAIFSGRQSFNF